MMDFVMRMPDLATVDATVTVVAWLKELGQHVKRGEPLLEVETDKAILPVESPVVGVLSEITAATGAEVATGEMIARLTVDEEATDAAKPLSSKEPASEPFRSIPIAAVATQKKDSTKAGSQPSRAPAAPRVSIFERNRQARAQASPAPAAPADPSAYKPEFLKSLYDQMVLIREFEDGVKFLFLEGAMPGTIHQCQGQEATATGVCFSLNPDDWITSTFRG